MPYISEKTKLAGTEYDKRIKLTMEDKKEVCYLYEASKYSIHGLAKKFKVSRRLIQFILFPERLVKARANRDWQKYYTKKKNRGYMKKHRRYKQTLYKLGLLKL